jgi:hypothetical protein
MDYFELACALSRAEGKRFMLKPDEELESRANADVLEPDHPCRCGHGLIDHYPDSLFCAECPCRRFEPATRDDLEEESE